MERVVYGVDGKLPGWEALPAGEVGERLREMGCDAVFLKQLEPEWVEALHGAGLRVYASFGVFIDNSPLDDTPLWERWPESRPTTAAGAPAPQQEWYRPLLPSHPRVRAHRLVQLEALVAALPLDGVWLDFIRWPGRWEAPQPLLYHSSFDPITLRQFQRDTDVALPESVEAAGATARAEWIQAEAADTWFAWRCQQIAAFVAAARAVLRRRRPGARLGLFTVPWMGTMQMGTQPDAPAVDDAHIRIWGQDPALLSQYADVLSPMVYHRLCGQPTPWVRNVTEQVAQATKEASALKNWAKNGNIRVWPVVEAIEPPDSYAANEFEQACRGALAAEDGLIVFKAAGLLQDAAKVARWRTLHVS